MGATQEVLQTVSDSGIGISKLAMGIASAGTGLGIAAIRSVHMVPEGHVGVRTRFGKAKRPDTKLATRFGNKANDL